MVLSITSTVIARCTVYNLPIYTFTLRNQYASVLLTQPMEGSVTKFSITKFPSYQVHKIQLSIAAFPLIFSVTTRGHEI
jgi:hypothetical protein